MKIGIIIFKYFPYGGLQRDFLRLALLLTKKCAIEIFTTEWAGEIPENLSVNLIHIKGLTNHSRMNDFANKAIERARSLHCKMIVGFNKIPGIDIYFASDNCYREQVSEKHGFFYKLLPRYHVYAGLEKKMFQSNNMLKILALADSQKKKYQKHYDVPDEQFYVLPPDFPFVEESAGKEKIIRDSLGINQNESMILMVCSAFKTKGVDRALKAFKKLPFSLINKSYLVIIGDDNEKPYWQLARKLGIERRVKFLGAKKNVFEYMFSADLFLHPAYQEAAGKVLLEAMSCGLPVLTTANCGYAEHVEKANAGIVLSYPFLHINLVEALKKMLVSEDKTMWKNKALIYSQRYPKGNLISEAANRIENMAKAYV